MLTQVIHEMISPVIALIAGIFAYTYMSQFMRVLFFQLVLWILVYCLSYAVTNYQRSNGLIPNNEWVFNIYIPLEFLALTLAVYIFMSGKLVKYLVLASFGVFLLLMAKQIWSNGHEKFVHYTMALGSIIMTSIFIFVLYKIFNSEQKTSAFLAEILASLGLIIYFACSVPFISSLSYLNEHSPDTSKKLFNYITDNLALIRYGMLAIAFLWVIKYNSHKAT